jgi:hypothetical protein
MQSIETDWDQYYHQKCIRPDGMSLVWDSDNKVILRIADQCQELLYRSEDMRLMDGFKKDKKLW